MPSQFFGLYIAGSGLRASNAALNTTANNISNSQTTGYSRQVVTQEANNALRTFTTYGCAGAGVDTIAIERVRDEFYDVKYWNNQTKLGNYEVKQYYMTSIEDYFNDDNSSGFKSLFNKMQASLQSLTTDSNSTAAKKQFISGMNALTDYFNDMYGNLQELQNDTNLEIKQTADQINSIAEKLATLNKQINVVELSGGTANELRDQRDKLIDELSLYVNVEAKEYPITDPNNPSRETGGHTYVVTIAGGQMLVNGSDYNSLVCTARSTSEKVNQSDIDGLYDIYWENGNEFSLTNAQLGGRLAGLVQMRDGNNGNNFTGTCIGVDRVTKDGKTNSVATIAVTSEMLKDMNKCNLSDTGGVITIGNQKYYYSSWEYNGDGTYKFTMDDEKCDQILTSAQVQSDVKIGSAIDYQGIPYYISQMNEFVRSFSQAVNNLISGGFDVNGDEACYLLSGNTATGKTQYTKGDLTDSNGYYEVTAGNIGIWSDLIADADLLGTRANKDNGVEECDNVKALISLLSDKSLFSFRNASASEFLETILADVALNTSDANTFCDTYGGLAKSIDNQRLSVSGVDEDEEAINLVKYQNSYTLASKMIQTLTEVYDRLILQTGV